MEPTVIVTPTHMYMVWEDNIPMEYWDSVLFTNSRICCYGGYENALEITL